MKTVSRQWLVVGLILTTQLLVLGGFAAAQQQKIHRIGFLLAGGSTDPSRRDAFINGLRALGYAEGKNILIEWRRAEGKLDRLNGLAAELVNLKVDVIVTGGNTATRAAQKSTSVIPIVTALSGDPVENGFIASLARPGENTTGLTSLGPELTEKRLELLRETVPKLSRVLVLGNSTTPGNSRAMKHSERIAIEFSTKSYYHDIAKFEDIEATHRIIKKSPIDAILMLPNAVLLFHRVKIVELANNNRLPMMYDAKEYVESGGLMSYAAEAVDLFRRAATYVDKILKGAKPADLPVEQPTKFEFIVNLKTAKQIGLTIPPNVLARADRVIR